MSLINYSEVAIRNSYPATQLIRCLYNWNRPIVWAHEPFIPWLSLYNSYELLTKIWSLYNSYELLTKIWWKTNADMAQIWAISATSKCTEQILQIIINPEGKWMGMHNKADFHSVKIQPCITIAHTNESHKLLWSSFYRNSYTATQLIGCL